MAESDDNYLLYYTYVLSSLFMAKASSKHLYGCRFIHSLIVWPDTEMVTRSHLHNTVTILMRPESLNLQLSTAKGTSEPPYS